MLLQEGTALAMTKAEEHHVDLLPGHLAGKAEVGLAVQALVHFAHRIAGIGFAIGKDYLCLGMVQQHTDEFTTSVACRTKYTNFNHILFALGSQQPQQKVNPETYATTQSKYNKNTAYQQCINTEILGNTATNTSYLLIVC